MQTATLIGLRFWMAAALGAGHPAAGTAPSPFLVKPYLQLGSTAPAPDTLALLWHGPDQDGAWSVQVRRRAGGPWDPPRVPAWTRVAVPGVEPHRVYRALLGPLAPGARFTYRVDLDGRPVFQSPARARMGPDQPMRVAVLADLADGHAPSRAMAWQVWRQRPDLAVLPGDLVYQDGRISEYRAFFYPVYNADRPGPDLGAPLLRETLTVGALGNHDVGERGPRRPFAVDPDALAYYLYWDQPLNGPLLNPRGPNAPPLHPGPDWTWEAFLRAAGSRFPTMGSFSFDAGGVHWTVLDSNPHVRWDAPGLEDWLERDLEGARRATWRFVVFHHPAFNLAEGNRYVDQWMARIWPILERHRVDLAFAGHIHVYVRTQPLRFTPDPASLAALDPVTQQGPVTGRLDWDRSFDGRARTRARGVIQIITGGGGAHLHLQGRNGAVRPSPYATRVITQEYSFSVLDIRGRRVVFRQLGIRGGELDRFVLTK